MDYAYKVFLLLGGIGLFLFGINYLSSALEEALGSKLRTALEKLTSKNIYALLVGIGVTALIQSSGATMVMVIGFINARMMNLLQGLYIMLGAAIGTTITAQIIAFDIENFAPLILFVGMILVIFIKNSKANKLGAIILGFGLLFTGIYLMGNAIELMELSVVVQAFLNNVNSPILSMLFGFVFTFIIQSSSASVGILQVIAMSMAPGAFSLSSVVYMILGMNIGAVAPAVISSFSAGRQARRAALAVVFTKLLSALVFIVLMLIFPQIISMVEGTSPAYERQIANFHLLFNALSAIMLLPLVKPISIFCEKIMPDLNEDDDTRKLIYVSKDLSRAPMTIIAQAKSEIFRYATICRDNLVLAMESFFETDVEKAKKVQEKEEDIDYLCHELDDYLVSLSSIGLDASDSRRIRVMISVVSDLERIADHAENISEYTQLVASKEAHISDDAYDDLRNMVEKVKTMLDLSIKTYIEKDLEGLGKATILEEEIDRLQELCIEGHINRLMEGKCNPRGGIMYSDMVSDLERIADHALNVAEGIKGIQVLEE